MDNKTYIELTKEEVDQRASLTMMERLAVDQFIKAAKALPKSICISLDENDFDEPNLIVSKRITRGSCKQVAALRKKSLCF